MHCRLHVILLPSLLPFFTPLFLLKMSLTLLYIHVYSCTTSIKSLIISFQIFLSYFIFSPIVNIFLPLLFFFELFVILFFKLSSQVLIILFDKMMSILFSGGIVFALLFICILIIIFMLILFSLYQRSHLLHLFF